MSHIHDTPGVVEVKRIVVFDHGVVGVATNRVRLFAALAVACGGNDGVHVALLPDHEATVRGQVTATTNVEECLHDTTT